MDGFLHIILLAAIAGVFIWRLRAVLGRRPEDEHNRTPPYSSHRSPSDSGAQATAKPNGNVISLPGGKLPRDLDQTERPSVDYSEFVPEGSSAAQDLERLHHADRSFDPASFIEGAKKAYEMIVMAFASGDRGALQPLLSSDVMRSFNTAIVDREAKQERVEAEFIGIDKTEILNVSLTGKIVRITVKFISNMVSVTKNGQGTIIEGDPTKIKRVTDIWTFARDISSPDPNWRLAGTSAPTTS